MDQKAVRDFLADPATHGGPASVIETHASIIFLVPDRAYKMKKAVTYPYLNYGSLEKRRHFCAEEVRINRRTASDLYLDPLPVTLSQGSLAIGGDGEPVEWLVPMRRFDNELLFDRLAERGELTPKLCRDVADAIFDFHEAAEVVPEHHAVDELSHVCATIVAELRRHGRARFTSEHIDELEADWNRLLSANRNLLTERVHEGHCRRLHGDLHLRNIVLWKGRPTLFDAIEFDPAIAEIDTLYDVAFLLMDLLHRERKREANAILNRYLQRGGDYGSLPLLPLFLSLRAAIRAHTTASAATDAAHNAEAREYLVLARLVLEAPEPYAIAIGGASGTGKSTTAALVAPGIGGASGAVIIRSDVIRKRLHGKAPEEKLPESAYSARTSAQVFKVLAKETGRIIDAGQSVVLDAVFGSPANYHDVEGVLRSRGVILQGFWLDAPPSVLRKRVHARRNDASDADEAVLEQQLPHLQPPAHWVLVDAGGTPEQTAQRLLDRVACSAGPSPIHRSPAP